MKFIITLEKIPQSTYKTYTHSLWIISIIIYTVMHAHDIHLHLIRTEIFTIVMVAIFITVIVPKVCLYAFEYHHYNFVIINILSYR